MVHANATLQGVWSLGDTHELYFQSVHLSIRILYSL